MRFVTTGILGLALVVLGCGGSSMRAGEQPGDSLLELFSPPSPAESVAWASDPYDPGKRQRGVLILANAVYGGEPAYVELYRRAINDGDAAVRSAAARALSLHGSPEDAPVLANRLFDESLLVRRESARALQRLHNADVIDALVAAIDPGIESDPDVRERATAALGQYAELNVIQALIVALQDRMLRVNLAAEESLRILTGQELGIEPMAWVRWANSTEDHFAERQEYVYPVFHRDPTMAERLAPWLRAPNERPGPPVGMPVDDTG